MSQIQPRLALSGPGATGSSDGSRESEVPCQRRSSWLSCERLGLVEPSGSSSPCLKLLSSQAEILELTL